MRIATWNVEWFDQLFDDDGRPMVDAEWSGRRDVTRGEQLEAIAVVLSALDADAVMVIEAPDTSRRRNGVLALETLAEMIGIRAHKAVMGFANHTQQEITLLYDPYRLSARHDPRESDAAPRFDAKYRATANEPLMTWSKPPLELDVRLHQRPDLALRMIGVHVKSKAPHGARDKASLARIAIENRRKQIAQCQWLRARIDEHLALGEPLIVLGDFNDGPGLDLQDPLLGRSGVAITLGESGAPRLIEPHAQMALSDQVAARPSTARFRIPPNGQYLSALLDYIMVSPALCELDPRWRIWHPFDTPEIYEDPALRAALLAASDHFPVTLDLDLEAGKPAETG